MSGIYIPGERLPEKLTAMWIFPNGDVAVFGRNEDITRIRKAIPVPEHGRLIDGDKALADNEEYYSQLGRPDGVIGSRYRSVLMSINLAPTIIPEDPAEEGEG